MYERKGNYTLKIEPLHDSNAVARYHVSIAHSETGAVYFDAFANTLSEAEQLGDAQLDRANNEQFRRAA